MIIERDPTRPALNYHRIDDTVKKRYSSPQRRSLAKDGLRNCSKYVTICPGLSGIIRGKWLENVAGRNLGPIKWPTHVSRRVSELLAIEIVAYFGRRIFKRMEIENFSLCNEIYKCNILFELIIVRDR